MHHIKDFLNFLDITFATVWGFTLVELVPNFNSVYIFSSLDNIIKSLFALVGLIYAMVRCYFYYKKGVRENAKAILEEKILEQEIESLKNDMFNKKFHNEFINKK